MEIKFAANLSVAVAQRVPCAVIATESGVLIDRTHPHAQELSDIAAEVLKDVHALDCAEEDRWSDLIGRVHELAGEQAAKELSRMWFATLEANRKEAVEREAQAWVAEWMSGDLDKQPHISSELADALYAVGKATKPSPYFNRGLLAVFAYGYQRGQEARKEASV